MHFIDQSPAKILLNHLDSAGNADVPPVGGVKCASKSGLGALGVQKEGCAARHDKRLARMMAQDKTGTW